MNINHTKTKQIYTTMKFIELFNTDMSPNWAKIFTIPQFKEMLTTEQSKVWHKEGNVAIHTQNVVKNMIDYLDNIACSDKNSEYYKMMMCAAICHDLGKPSTTKFNEDTNDYTCKAHGYEGDKICRLLFWDDDIYFREKVCFMVRHHMDVFHLEDNNELYRRLITLSWGYVTVRDMCILNYCDAKGSKNDIESETDIKDRLERIKYAANNIGCYDDRYHFDSKKQKISFFYNPDETIQIKNKSNFNVYIMVGIAGSGKDTWIEKNKNGLPVVCRDTIRAEIGLTGDKPMGNKSQEDEVNRIAHERVIKFCEENKDFIVNNTNLSKSRREEYISLVMSYNPNIVMVYVEAPSIKELKKRRAGQIKESVISRMSKTLEYPERYEYDELIVDKQY